jgi:GAG-pre-integrase domain
MNSDTQPADKSENQAFLSFNKSQNPNLSKSKENERCDCCKKTGHTKERCWFLYPHLRPKKWRGGGGDRDGDKRKGESESKGYAAQAYRMSESDGLPSSSATNTRGPGEPSSSSGGDSMRQLMEQLSVMLARQNTNSCGIALNSVSYLPTSQLIIDTGATDHMMCNKNLFKTLEMCTNDQYILVANGTKVPITGIGTINLFSKEIKNILYIDLFKTNLISVSKITQEFNYDVFFSKNNVKFQDQITGMMIGEGFYDKGLYILNYQIINLCANKLSSENELWHKRLGHPSDRILNSFLNSPLNNCISCDICKLAKQTRLPFSLSISKSKAPFELIHSDVWGPAPTTSYNEFKYFVLFIDDFSRATWLYLLKSKSEVFQYFQEFVALVENQFSTKIKIFRSDNGT